MKKNLRLAIITLITIFFSFGVLCAEEVPQVQLESSTAQEIVTTLTLPAWTEHKDITGTDGITYKLYSFKEYPFSLENEGKPRLPVGYLSLQVPDDPDNFNIEILYSDSKIDNDILVYPAPHRYFEQNEQGLFSEKEQFTKDAAFYSQDTWYPNNPVEIKETAFLRQLKMVKLAIYPILFNPQQKQIKQFTSLKIRLTYTSNKTTNEVTVAADSLYDKMYKNLLPNYNKASLQTPAANVSLNPEDLPEPQIYMLNQDDIVNPSPDFKVDYLVVTAPLFYSSDNLYNLCDYRRSQAGGGYDVGVVSISDIYAQYPASSPEQSIKNFIQFVYANWRVNPAIPDLDFILLVGDADYGHGADNWFLPTWESTENDGYSATGDNDYACVSGTDTYPDLMLGRFPVKNETELNTMVSKTISFETNPPQGENHWGTRNLFLGGHGLNLLHANEARDMLINRHQETQEWIADEPDYAYDSAMAAGYINNEGCLIVTYNGHGGSDTWAPNVNIADLNNPGKTPAAVFSFACLTGYFDYATSDCYGEEWVKLPDKGSVAFFGSSRLADTVAWSYDPIVLNIIYNNRNYILGSVMQEMKAYAYVNSMFNLLGDPALNIANHIGESTKPDLSVASFSLSKAHPSIGETITINMQIQYKGLEPAHNVLVQLFEEINGQLIQVGNDWIIDALAGGSTTTLQQPWTYTGKASVHFVLKVDQNNVIEELSEYNNHQDSVFIFSSALYVDASNTSGKEYGTQAYPFTTINAALDYLADTGDSLPIYVMEGTYGTGGTLSIPFDVSLKGIGNKKNIIIKDSINATGSYISIENFTIDLNNAGSNVFRHAAITGNIFRHCERAIETVLGTIRNNIFYENNYVIYSLNSYLYLELDNNTIINNRNLLTLSTYSDIHRVVFLNNNIVRETGFGSVGSGITITTRYNNTDIEAFLNAGQTNINNINADPLFANPAAGDFHLDSYSPCIDAADTSLGRASSFDAEGNPRFDDQNIPNTGFGTPNYADIGAYERQSNSISPPKLEAVSNKTVYAGDTLSFQLIASDPRQDVLVFTTSALPEGAVLWRYNKTDINGDGVIDLSDQTIFASHYPSVKGDSKYDIKCDFNEDGNINSPDFSVFAPMYDQTLKQSPYFNKAGFSWRPSLSQRGSHTISFTVSDGQSSDTIEAKITVLRREKPDPKKPIIKSGE